MIELRAASPEDLPRIADFLRSANDSPYDISPVAEEKCFGRGLSGAPRTVLALERNSIAGLMVASARTIRLMAVARDKRRAGIGTRLLAAAEETVNGSVVEVAGEAGNYFVPGVRETDSDTVNFFRARGYETYDRAADLRVDLATDLIRVPAESKVRRARHDEREHALQFIERTFARAWSLEAARAFEHREPTLFIVEHDGRILGFSAHDANNRGLGFFGPEGVIAEMRGKGLGRELLLASLVDLRRMGFAETMIAWAAAHDFYRSVCGARVAHTFLRMRKKR